MEEQLRLGGEEVLRLGEELLRRGEKLLRLGGEELLRRGEKLLRLGEVVASFPGFSPASRRLQHRNESMSTFLYSWMSC